MAEEMRVFDFFKAVEKGLNCRINVNVETSRFLICDYLTDEDFRENGLDPDPDLERYVQTERAVDLEDIMEIIGKRRFDRLTAKKPEASDER